MGVIGFVPPQIMQWDKANLAGKIVTRNMVEVARTYVPEMRAKASNLSSPSLIRNLRKPKLTRVPKTQSPDWPKCPASTPFCLANGDGSALFELRQ